MEEAKEVVKREMEAPSHVLVLPNGEPFSVAVDLKVGKTWARMEKA